MQESSSPRYPTPVSLGIAVVACVLALAAMAWLIAARSKGREPDLHALVAKLDAFEAREPSLRQAGTGIAEAANAANPVEEARGPAQLRALESEFLGEPTDPAVAGLEASLHKAIDDRRLVRSGIVPATPEVSCRKQTCRIVAGFRNASDASDWAMLYLAFAGSGQVDGVRQALLREADGSVQLQLFARRSRAPPTLAP